MRFIAKIFTLLRKRDIVSLLKFKDTRANITLQIANKPAKKTYSKIRTKSKDFAIRVAIGVLPDKIWFSKSKRNQVRYLRYMAIM